MKKEELEIDQNHTLDVKFIVPNEAGGPEAYSRINIKVCDVLPQFNGFTIEEIEQCCDQIIKTAKALIGSVEDAEQSTWAELFSLIKRITPFDGELGKDDFIEEGMVEFHLTKR